MALADVAADVQNLGLQRSISSFAGGLVAAQVAGVSLSQVGAPVLFRTATVPNAQGISANGTSSPPSRIEQRTPQNDGAKASLEPQPASVAAIAPLQCTPRRLVGVPIERPGKLLLPVPARGQVAACGWSVHPSLDEDATVLPSMMLPVVAQLQEPPTSRKAARPLPARLQRLDDQTVMPREVYNRMLQQGDLARGSLGYGQHRLAFHGAEGKPVLRRAVPA